MFAVAKAVKPLRILYVQSLASSRPPKVPVPDALLSRKVSGVV